MISDFSFYSRFRGKYATVCRATHKKTGVEYAAKFIKKVRRNKNQMKEIVHEVAVLKECASSGRVVRLHEIYETTTEMVLVLELAAGGELQHILDGGQCLGEVCFNNNYGRIVIHCLCIYV